MEINLQHFLKTQKSMNSFVNPRSVNMLTPLKNSPNKRNIAKSLDTQRKPFHLYKTVDLQHDILENNITKLPKISHIEKDYIDNMSKLRKLNENSELTDEKIKLIFTIISSVFPKSRIYKNDILTVTEILEKVIYYTKIDEKSNDITKIPYFNAMPLEISKIQQNTAEIQNKLTNSLSELAFLSQKLKYQEKLIEKQSQAISDIKLGKISELGYQCTNLLEETRFLYKDMEKQRSELISANKKVSELELNLLNEKSEKSRVEKSQVKLLSLVVVFLAIFY